MSCLDAQIAIVPSKLCADISCIGSFCSRIERDSVALAVDAEREGATINACIKRCPVSIRSEIQREDVKLSVEVEVICSVSLPDPPYLEIEPEILWIWTMPAENNVRSNTDWIIE